jgi:DNA polymerase-3 subunit gamma/tau
MDRLLSDGRDFRALIVYSNAMAQGYTVLARRYRSQDFSQLLGQEPIAQTLRNAVTSGRIAHAFIFTGTRGVGKTSAARILAKAINCPNCQGGEPCGQCSSCTAIAVGEDIDVIEIDGASNNGVDQIRELRQNTGISPTRSKFKIYIIDEVHMLTTQAFNALLKTLEEPPPHVKFIFATTDIHRVPATILSRCQRYDFKNIPTDIIAAHLAAICQDEKAAAQPGALHRIAVLAAGSMRDALSLLDRVLSLGAGEITESLLNDLLGTPPLTDMCDLITAMLGGDAAAALTRADAMLASGMSAEYFVSELTVIFRHLMVMGVCGTNTGLVDVASESRQQLAVLSARLAPQLAAHHIVICDHTVRQLRNSTMPRPLLDALMVRFSMAAEFAPIRQWLKELPGGGDAAAEEKKNDTAPRLISPTPAPQSTPADAAPVRQHSEPPSSTRKTPITANMSAISQQPRRTVTDGEHAPPQSIPAEDRPVVDPAHATDAATSAPELAACIAALKQTGGSSGQVIAGSLMGWKWLDDASGVILQINKKVETFVQGQHARSRIESAAATAAGRPVKVEFEALSTPETDRKPTPLASTHPSPPPQRISPELQQQVLNQPGVKLLQEKFNAQLVQIEPLAAVADEIVVPDAS